MKGDLILIERTSELTAVEEIIAEELKTARLLKQYIHSTYMLLEFMSDCPEKAILVNRIGEAEAELEQIEKWAS